LSGLPERQSAIASFVAGGMGAQAASAISSTGVSLRNPATVAP
jgi:hypothetical protein